MKRVRTEVLSRLGYDVRIKLKDDPSKGLVAIINIEVGVRPILARFSLSHSCYSC